MPEISVVMSVYNGEAYLKQAVESILNQTFPDFEFIILNDCSIDRTANILQDYAERDSRIKILHNEQNLGLTASLNRGLRAAQGAYIARQDADDISLPTRFAEQVHFLNQNPDVVLVSGNIEQINAAGQVIGHLNRAAPPELVRWYMLFYNHISGHSQVMFRREAALKVGGYDESLPYSQDYDLWLRLLASGEIAMLPRTWLQWRTHQENISTQKFAQQEHLSLSLSQRELSRLLGRALDLETVAYLRGFWLEPFPPTEEAGNIHRLLWEVYSALTPQPPLPSRASGADRVMNVGAGTRAFMPDSRPFSGRYRSLRSLVPAPTVRASISRMGGKTDIKKTVAERFFRWARSVSLRQHPLTKLKLWFYAWRWTCTGN